MPFALSNDIPRTSLSAAGSIVWAFASCTLLRYFIAIHHTPFPTNCTEFSAFLKKFQKKGLHFFESLL